MSRSPRCLSFLAIAIGRNACSWKLRKEPEEARSLICPDSSATVSQPRVHERQVRLSWGYVLRQLKQVGAEHAHWHLIDTSQSGISGHSGKVDFCFSVSQQRAWPQVVALAELKKDLQTESQHVECLGLLTARAENIFTNQLHREYVLMVAGGLDGLEVFAFFRTGSILRSGMQAWAFDPSSDGLRWLCKLLFSSQAAMGFVRELPPLMTPTPQGRDAQRLGWHRWCDRTCGAGLSA